MFILQEELLELMMNRIGHLYLKPLLKEECLTFIQKKTLFSNCLGYLSKAMRWAENEYLRIKSKMLTLDLVILVIEMRLQTSSKLKSSSLLNSI